MDVEVVPIVAGTESLNKLKAIVSEENQGPIIAFESAFADFLQIAAQVRQARRKNTNRRAFALSVGTGREFYKKAEARLQALADRSDQNFDQVLASANDAADRVGLGERFVQALFQAQLAEQNIILATSQEHIEHSREAHLEAITRAQAKIAELALNVPPEGEPLLATLEQAFQAFRDVSDQVVTMALLAETPAEIAAARELAVGEEWEALGRVETALKPLIDLSQTVHLTAAITLDNAAQRSRLTARCLQELIMLQRLDIVHEGMQAQAQGAQQINEAMLQLSGAAQQTVESLRGSTRAIAQLHQVSEGLHDGRARLHTESAPL
jgi:hypothetical protein